MLFSVFMFSASWDGLSVKEQSLKRFQSKFVACNFCNLFASYYVVCFMSSSGFRICLGFSRFGSLNLLSLLKLIQVWVRLWCSLQVWISCMIWICLYDSVCLVFSICILCIEFTSCYPDCLGSFCPFKRRALQSLWKKEHLVTFHLSGIW